MDKTAPIVEMRDITKLFPGTKALDSVQFTLNRGEIHAIVGENGAGKSTLVKILTGVFPPTSGSVLFEGKEVQWKSTLESQRGGIAAIYQDPMVFPDLSVAENIFIANQKVNPLTRKIAWKQLYRDTERILVDLGVRHLVHPRMLVDRLSIAQRQLVDIAKALSIKAKVIVMDEPTSSLSATETKKLYEITTNLRDRGVSVVIISHKPEDIFGLADRVSIYRDGRYVGTRDVADVGRQELINLMVGRDINDLFPKSDAVIGAEILRVEHLSRTGAFRDVSFALHRGEILGLSGLVGSGRSELAEAIFGASPADSGGIMLDGKAVRIRSPKDAIKLGIGFVTENRTINGLILDMSVGDNIILHLLDQFGKNRFFDRSGAAEVAERKIGQLNIKAANVDQPVKFLSGGNQQKVVISKWLSMNPKVLILDEPTKGVDVGTKAVIHGLISQHAQAGIGILLISSELPEIIGMSDNVIVMHEGRLTGTFARKNATQQTIMEAAVS